MITAEQFQNHLPELEVFRQHEINRELALKSLNYANEMLKRDYSAELKPMWFEWLDLTSRSGFLSSLEHREFREQWAELVFRVLQISGYSFLDMFEQRVIEIPNRILFKDMHGTNSINWTYKQVHNHVREIAALLYRSNPEPRVAIFSANSVESASADLACLMYGIFNTPLNVHFSAENIAHIINVLKINVVLVDNQERIDKILGLTEQIHHDFTIYTLDTAVHPHSRDYLSLPQEIKQLNQNIISDLLEHKKVPDSRAVATTMFTSGSTGVPKGVSFSYYNLVSKRFARHAALPEVGKTPEVMLCFLPLFHTFGRYLELMGSIYWRGTYVFAGNPSAETLLKLFPIIKPTGFISVPIRWMEIYEKAIEKIRDTFSFELQSNIFREITGNELRWGLSAAGYLSPNTFKFFHKFGVQLCSGFGMTEATGGITMTPPHDYQDDSTGVPLPGIFTRLTDAGELELSGHYLARYLDDAGPGDLIPFPFEENSDFWLPTGDIFKIFDNGHYEIVDRVKDIYKNDKGQTIAPRTIEKKFIGVPGIKNTFLVGDARPYNVLLIVPDNEDPIITESRTLENLREYYHQIIMAANKDVAPYERVINFDLLARDFSTEHGELTAKGSFNRKNIEKNFAHEIEMLYQSKHVRLQANDIEIVIPRWFFRDLGILETDIILIAGGIYNKRQSKILNIKYLDENQYLIGDLVYTSKIPAIDIGRFARQPRLWIGNPQLIDFCPVKEGWDLSLRAISSQVNIPKTHTSDREIKHYRTLKGIHDAKLILVNNMIINSLFGGLNEAYTATSQLGEMFSETDDKLSEAIRRRMESLACHPEEKLRILSYRILLLNDPTPDYSKILPAFIHSGLSFLNEESIREIALSNLGKKHLESLRQRLYAYRLHLQWPADAGTRAQFENIIKLLFSFCQMHIEYYKSIRSELASWVLHRADPILSDLANGYFDQLYDYFVEFLDKQSVVHPPEVWNNWLVFENGIPHEQQERVRKLLSEKFFLKQSIMLAFNDFEFRLDEIKPRGIWVVRLTSLGNFRHFRITINTRTGKHYDLHIVLPRDEQFQIESDELFWLAALTEHPLEIPVLPPLGGSRTEVGLRSSQYLGGLSVWERIRQLSEIHQWAGYEKNNAWRQLFVKAMAVYFRAWRLSGYKIVPGAISTSNVMVPEVEFHESASILTLTGFKEYENTLSLIKPMMEDFYDKTSALYPWTQETLNADWLFEAIIEGLGIDESIEFLKHFSEDIKANPDVFASDYMIPEKIDLFLDTLKHHYIYPFKLFDAISQYHEWVRINSYATNQGKEQTISELIELFKIYQLPEVVRYYLYRHTYFSSASDKIRSTFDKLLAKLEENVQNQAYQLIELSELQNLITESDLLVFNKMVFPRIQSQSKIDFMKVGENNKGQIIVRTASH